jgi:hypothetical protein
MYPAAIVTAITIKDKMSMLLVWMLASLSATEMAISEVEDSAEILSSIASDIVVMTLR